MFSFCSPKTVIYYLILISSINRRPQSKETSVYQGHPAIVYVSGTRSSDRKMHWSWSWTRILIGLLIIKSLGNAGEGGGDRSLHWKSRSFPYANRIETCSSWKWRWPRLLRITSSATHTYVDFPTRSMYQPEYRHVTDHRKTCMPGLWIHLRYELRNRLHDGDSILDTSHGPIFMSSSWWCICDE